MRRHKTTKREIKTQLALAFRFILSIMAFYILFWLIMTSVDLTPLKTMTANAANALLNAAGVPSNVAFNGEPSIIVGNVTAQITNLCAGDLEIALLTAIILSTSDRSLRRRLIGVTGGLITILILNPLRIFIVLATGYYSSWQWADFTHDVLFRATLLTVIVAYYFAWYVRYDAIAKLIKRKRE
jgi:exosortase/archaeosortase family protein